MVLLDLSLTDPKILEKTTEGEEAFLCFLCKTKITEKKFLISISDGTPFHSFTNPYGIAFNVMTVSYCEMVVEASERVLEHTWFPGYDWSILICANCREHLGWKYHSSDQQPSNFYALIRGKLIMSI
jgi:cereblon